VLTQHLAGTLLRDVAINQQHGLVTFLRDRHRQVDSGMGLAFTRNRTGDEDHVAFLDQGSGFTERVGQQRPFHPAVFIDEGLTQLAAGDQHIGILQPLANLCVVDWRPTYRR